ncbi:hypothetical protein TL16_g06574 [Triparma laevis f. inornata]|uniref:Uncharacterized protein n=1 Tax=Triparma laevis f. inornata TaxID=1714386 RepID=A0A9W7EEA0_9STRA|nr:hypothetical protein TL16_g06574 [Triparma laevis f. inornata]
MSRAQLESFLDLTAKRFLHNSNCISERDYEYATVLLSSFLSFANNNNENVEAFDNKEEGASGGNGGDANQKRPDDDSTGMDASSVGSQDNVSLDRSARLTNDSLGRSARLSNNDFSSVGRILPSSDLPPRSDRLSNNNDFSSVGRILSNRKIRARVSAVKIAPIMGKSSTACQTAFGCLNSPEAKTYAEAYNKDLDIETKTGLQMDCVIQTYTSTADKMITTGLRINSGMKMIGAIPFKNFKTTISTTQFLDGYYNSKSGDIYTKTSFTVRGDHSRVAARIANYDFNCRNPAFSLREDYSDRVQYLEVPNSHSAIIREDYIYITLTLRTKN